TLPHSSFSLSSYSVDHRYLHSFPTRRSSDLESRSLVLVRGQLPRVRTEQDRTSRCGSSPPPPGDPAEVDQRLVGSRSRVVDNVRNGAITTLPENAGTTTERSSPWPVASAPAR